MQYIHELGLQEGTLFLSSTLSKNKCLFTHTNASLLSQEKVKKVSLCDNAYPVRLSSFLTVLSNQIFISCADVVIVIQNQQNIKKQTITFDVEEDTAVIIIIQFVDNSSTMSLRRPSLQLDMNKLLIRNTIKRLKIKPYKPIFNQYIERNNRTTLLFLMATEINV